MIVLLPAVKNPKSGKGFFILRLARAFLDMGVHVTFKHKVPHDIALHAVRIKKPSKQGPNVLRLDGVYHDTGKDWKAKNVGIKKSLKAADAVIYQSQHSKKLCDKFLGKTKKPTAVIFNGADPGYYDNIVPLTLPARFSFIAASRWRPHKRLEDTMQGWLKANLREGMLYVAGDVKQAGIPKKRLKIYFSQPNITYLGVLKQDKLAAYVKTCVGLIHLCWFDACPNSVVEALCARTRVVCNNVGGTPELVGKGGGIICKIDKPYNYKPVDLYHPPAVDLQKIADGIKRVAMNWTLPDNSHVYIKIIARHYADFFQKVINANS